MESKDNSKKKPETITDSELNEIMKKNEELLNFQKECDAKIETLKNENMKKTEEIKTKNNLELFEIIIAELKDYLQSQNRTNEITEEKQKLKDKISNEYYKAKQADQNYEELEEYNTELLKKIKAINEEKNQIEIRLKQNHEETLNQCNKFKEEYQKKFDEISNEVILKENEELKVKIKECEENTNKIKQNISEQMEMRKQQADNITNMLNGQINDKLNEINKETGKFDEENAKLQIDIQIEKAKFGDKPDLTKEFNKKFDKAKKEYEKVFKDLVQLTQENHKLKELDPVSIRKENEKNKELLDDLVKRNKDLQNKIKELKNKKNEATENPPKPNEPVKEEEDEKQDEKVNNKIENI